MIRLALVGSLLGCLAALGIAWEFRDSVAYAEEAPVEPQDCAIATIATAMALCLDRGDTWLARPDGGSCVPVPNNLGVYPIPRRKP